MNNFFIKNNTNNKGFTLIELMVVVAIIAIISAISLFNSSRLNSAVLLSNTAYEIGLIIRDAQVSGLGAKVASSGLTATTSNQGVYFDMSTQDKIIFFADVSRDNIRSLDTTEDSQVFNIENKRAGKVTQICLIGNTGDCVQEVSDLTIMFKRPNPEAYFYSTDFSDSSPAATGYLGSVAINVGFDDGGDCRSIIIYKTGAIQIDRRLCHPITN